MDSPIEALPTQKLLDHIAEKWGLSHLVFVRKMENIVYSCKHSQGKAYLRLTTPFRRSFTEIAAEIAWIEHLAKSGLPVPELIATSTGEKIVTFSEGDQTFVAVVFLGVAGEHPSETHVIGPTFLHTLGSLIAKMHLASSPFKTLHAHYQREEWFNERGIRHALAAAPFAPETDLRERFDQTIAWMRTLPRTSDHYGLIHADLGALNLFIGEDDTITIIDFDDCCDHWFVFDLAIVIFSMAGRFEVGKVDLREQEWIRTLVAGYRTIRPLSDTEISWIPRLIEFACLRLFFWITYHESLHTFHLDALEKVTLIKKWLKSRLHEG